MGNGDISPARRKGSLPPEVERILQAIGFVDRFSRLPTNLAPQDRMEIKTCREPARGALRELGRLGVLPPQKSAGVRNERAAERRCTPACSPLARMGG